MKSIGVRTAAIAIAAIIPAAILASPRTQHGGTPTATASVSRSSRSDHASLRRRGDALRKSGDADAALAVYLEYVQDRFVSPSTYADIGDIYFAKNDLPQALRYYETAITKSYRDPQVYFMIAVVMARTGRYQEAIERYRVGEEKLHDEITVDFPKDLKLTADADGMRRLEAAAYTGVGLTCFFTGRRAEANKHFTAAAEADPTFDYALRYYTNPPH